MPDAPAPLVCLLGMHRSGTSCLAGALASAGLCLNSRSSASPHNRKGNFENHAIVVFHETVLKSLGGSWYQPPALVTWQDRHRARALELVAEYPHDRPCGFKDPRTLLHLGQWLALPLQLRLAGIFRHPLACAASLQQRDGMGIGTAVALWETYNRHLLAAWQRQPFPLLDFDAAPDAFYRQLQATARWLGLGQAVDTAFFEESLRHNRPPAGQFGHGQDSAETLYRGLLEASASFFGSSANS